MFKPLLVFLLWNLVVGVFLLMGNATLGLPIALGLAALFLWGYLLRPPRGMLPHEHHAALRLRPLGHEGTTAVLVSIPVLLLLSWSAGDVYTRFVRVPPESLDPFGPILGTLEGRLVISVFAIGVAPIIEEFVFRGLIQRSAEQKYGAATGIGVAAFLFAAIHLLPWVLPLHFFLGVIFGFAVYATRSIWAGVALHAANNTAAMITTLLGREQDELLTVWDVGFTPGLAVSIGVLLLSIPLAAWAARKLLQAGGRDRLPAGPALA